jgi:hypothetical protein
MLQAITPFPALFAALIVGTDQRIVRTLRKQHALSPDAAVPLPTRFGIRRWRMQRLIGRGAVIQVQPDRVYLDEAGWQAYRTSRRRRMLIVLAILVPAIAYAMWMSGRAV